MGTRRDSSLSLEIYIAYTLAASLVLVIPGPTIIFVMSQAVTHGRWTVPPLVAGVTLGDLTAMTFSLFGLGAVLASSSLLFTLLKWLGAVYLIFLGVKLLRSRPSETYVHKTKRSASKISLFKQVYIVTALNPKSILFFVAFMPQFVVRGGNQFLQLVVLGATFLVLAAFNASLYGIFAGQLSEIMANRKIKRFFDLLAGCALLGAGIFTAFWGRP